MHRFLYSVLFVIGLHAASSYAESPPTPPKLSSSVEVERLRETLSKKYQGREMACDMEGCFLKCQQGDPNPSAWDCGASAGADKGPANDRNSTARNGGSANNNGNQQRTSKGPKGNGEDGKEAKNDPTKAPSLPVGQLAQATPQGQCDYGGGTRLTEEFYNLRRKCDSAFRSAAKLCDLASHQGVQSAMSSARAAAQKVSAAASSKQSLLQACNSYTKSVDELKDALESYRKGCVPTKDECENSCMSASKSAKSISGNLSNNSSCVRSAISRIRDLEKHSETSNSNFSSCYAHRDPLERAESDVKELTASITRSNLCEQNTAETCRLDPQTGACIIGAGEGSRFASKGLKKTSLGGSLDEENGRLSRSLSSVEGLEEISAIKPVSSSGAYGAMGSPSAGKESTFRDFDRSSLNGARNTEDEKSKKGLAGRSRRDSFYGGGRYRRGKKKWASSGYRGRIDRQKTKGKESGKSKHLKKYLPGGQKDPEQAGKSLDGITGAMGPDLFEKVSRRYQLYEDRLFQEKQKK